MLEVASPAVGMCRFSSPVLRDRWRWWCRTAAYLTLLRLGGTGGERTAHPRVRGWVSVGREVLPSGRQVLHAPVPTPAAQDGHRLPPSSLEAASMLLPCS